MLVGFVAHQLPQKREGGIQRNRREEGYVGQD